MGLIALVFFTVSGGAYGLEEVVGDVGAKMALLLICLVPLLWSLPVALMAGELAASLPVSGGYYRWVQQAMGAFWGFQEGWWSWLFTFVDMALYPVLCGDILAQSWPLLSGGHSLSAGGSLAFILGFIWIATALNWGGARVVADYSLAVMLLVLAPFLVFVVRAFFFTPAVHVAAHAASGTLTSGLGLALAAVLWNYSGWDNVGTFAPAVHEPQKTYPRGLLLALLVIFLAYLLPLLAGLRLDPVAADWKDGYFVQLGAHAWGPALMIVMMLTAVMSAWAQYTSQLLYVLPLPVNLARDGYLPGWLARADARGVPAYALLVSSGLYTVFALASFSRLLVADMLLYAAGLSLEFASLVALRKRQPDLPRPFQVRLRGAWLTAFCVVPFLVVGGSLALAARRAPAFAVLALAMVATGPIAYGCIRLRRTRTVAASASHEIGAGASLPLDGGV